MNTVEYKVNGKRYRMISDLHTHTRYSHGKGTIEENVRAARDRGIRTLGITDHGYGHIAFGLTKKKVKAMQKEIETLRVRYPEMEILLGVEANVIPGGCGLDMAPEDFADFDYVIAGFHFGALGVDFIQNSGIAVRNLVKGRLGIGARRITRLNTEYMVNAVMKNRLKFITHPWDKIESDLLEIAVTCAKRDTMIEINTGHLSTLQPEDLRTMALADVKFIITSDAHSPGRVGDFMSGLTMALSAGIDVKRIVNIEVC